MIRITRNTKKLAIFMTFVMVFTPVMSGHLRKLNSDKRTIVVVSDLNLGPVENETNCKNKKKILKKEF